jgi:protocatechuate 3,4-dioxygenase beta subunit
MAPKFHSEERDLSEVDADEAGSTRRAFALRTIGGVAAVMLGSCIEPASGEGGADAGAGAASPTPPFQAAGTCTLYPKETQGPFYLNLGLLRQDITDGKPGKPLRIVVQVVKKSGCSAIQGKVVDIWHADANGWYSGYPGQGDDGDVDTSDEQFLRGSQVTDSDGTVTFQTIYPGWYHGRTTHIHFKVRLSSTSVVTSQFYFPESTTTAVYNTAPYSERGQKDTSNAADHTAHTGGGMPPLLALTSDGAGGYIATIKVTVNA